jgi:hypothetical protein
MSHEYLAGFLRFFEKQPEVAERVKGDALTEADLFFLRDYCRTCYAFAGRSFEFKHSVRGPAPLPDASTTSLVSH